MWRWTAIAIPVLLVMPLAVAQKRPVAPSLDCAGCHSEASLAKEVDGKVVSLHVDPKLLSESVHGFLSCSDCHTGITGFPHDPSTAKVSCGGCHEEAQKKYDISVHAKARESNHGSRAATCTSCHGDLHILKPSSDPASRTHHSRVAETCGYCHGVKFVMEGTGISQRPFLSYAESVHGKAVADGSEKAAVCSDCHNSHDILAAGDQRSTIFKFNVPATCGRCHQDVQKQFGASIHGTSLARGNWQAPVCTDCHGIHAIKPHIDPNSSVAAQSLARTTCGKCHEGVRLSEEFGIEGRRTSTYMDSYHGMASALGSSVAANCASCHGVHNILPSTDAASTINKANLPRTCGQCHPGAGENFAAGKVHMDIREAGDTGTAVVRWVRWFYLWMIVGVIGGMLLHNLIIWRFKVMRIKALLPRRIVRMNLNQRIQHAVLLTSFFALVFTGFALTYPDSWLAWLLGSSESVRRIGHRIAAIVLLAVGAYHLLYIAFTREGRDVLRGLVPGFKDMRDFIQTMRYYLRLSPDSPRYGRFSYPEKAEYWALIWGMVVMAATGLAAWFQVPVVKLLPRWSIDVALAIHFYEAVLATLAIIVWHFYQVIFDPDVYPLNFSFWDGRMSEEHYRHEHPLHYSELRRAEIQAEDAASCDPPASGLEAEEVESVTPGHVDS
jgi:cytochrome b subunit of formate dehydrogenase